MSMKQIAQDLDYNGLRLLQIHYAIWATLEIATGIANDESNPDLPVNGIDSFADWVCDLNDTFEFDEREYQNIIDILTNEYADELTHIIQLVENKNKPKSWAYLTQLT